MKSRTPKITANKQNKIFVRLGPGRALFILVVVGFLFRLFLMRYRFAVAFDEVNYLKLGVSGHLNGFSDILHTYWSPLLPAIISFFCHLINNYELAGRLVSILAGTILGFPVYYLGKQVYDQRVGLVAAGFVAIFPPLAFQSTLILTEAIYMLFAASAVLFGLQMLKKYSIGFAILTGLTTGFAYLAHPQGVGYLVVLAFWIVFASLTKKFQIKPLRVIWLMAGLLFGFLLAASSYLIFLKNVTGTWTLSTKAAANLQMEAPSEGQGDPFRSLDSRNQSVAIDRIFHQGDFLQATDQGKNPIRAVHFAPFVMKYIKNVSIILQNSIPELLTTIPMLLLAAGLLGASWQPRQGILVLYLLSFIIFFWFGLIPAFHVNLRYLSPLWPVCTIWVAKGALHVYSWLSVNQSIVKLSRRFKITSGSLALSAIVSIFLLLSFLPEFGRVISRQPGSKDYWADPVEQKLAGQWLKKNFPGPKVIMSRNHAVDFYAGNYNITQSVTIPRNSLERLLEYAEYRNVDFLVLNERYKKSHPELNFLFTSIDSISGMKLIYDQQDLSGLKTRIFKIL